MPSSHRYSITRWLALIAMRALVMIDDDTSSVMAYSPSASWSSDSSTTRSGHEGSDASEFSSKDGSYLRARSADNEDHLSLALGVVSTAFGIVLIAIVWWILHRCRRSSTKKTENDYHHPTIIYHSPLPQSIPLSPSPLPIATFSTPCPSVEGQTASTTLCGGTTSPEYQHKTMTNHPHHNTAEQRCTISSSPSIQVPFPAHYWSTDMHRGSDPPFVPFTPAPATPHASKRHSSYTPRRANSISYYQAANDVVGSPPRHTSSINIASGDSHGYGPRLEVALDGFSRERIAMGMHQC